jgi:hypothetical protein
MVVLPAPVDIALFPGHGVLDCDTIQAVKLVKV